MIHKHTEIPNGQGSASVSPIIQEICFYLSRLASALLALQLLVQSLRETDLEPSSETTALRYLKLVTVPRFCCFTLISLMVPLALFFISLVFSALISILYLVQVLSRLSNRASNSCFSPARASMSSANPGLVIFLPPVLTFPSCSSRASDMNCSRKLFKTRKLFKKVGDKRHHCFTPKDGCSKPYSRVPTGQGKVREYFFSRAGKSQEILKNGQGNPLVSEDMVQILLMLEILFIQVSKGRSVLWCSFWL